MASSQPTMPGPSSVLSLLTTDVLPEGSSSSSSSSSLPPDGIPLPPTPQLLQPSLPAYLDTINEEESDDLRSVSSTSFTSPRTVIDTTLSSNEHIDKQSTYSVFSDSDYRSPEARSPQQIDRAVGSESPSELDYSSDSQQEITVIEVAQADQTVQPTQASSSSVEAEAVDDLPSSSNSTNLEFSHHLLQELTKLGKEQQLRSLIEDSSISSSSSSSERSIISQVAKEMAAEQSRLLAGNLNMDADRDQDEEIVYNEERRKTVTMDDDISLNSVSINLDATKDSILNQSITSNPMDETSIVMESTARSERPSERPPSPPYDLPPPPVDLKSSRKEYSLPPLPLPPPPPPPPSLPLKDLRSPIRPAPPPPSILHPTPLIAKAKELQQLPFTIPTGPPPPPPPPPPASYSDSYKSDRSRISSVYDRSASYPLTMTVSHPMVINDSRADQGMSSPPNEPPPPPPQPLNTTTKSGFSSREDLLSENAAPSRSTIREIPVQRAPSAVPSQSTVLDYRMPSSYAPPANNDGDEYYRREVISRTIITRSTEALSQPPLGRSSPIERYITYPDPMTREERTVDYKVTYHRDIEEEERRLREEQEKRRVDEHERRRREEETRRQWELKEQELLDRLRRDREHKEREFERNITERERAEKDRIEKDRLERERLEMLRRADWERMENERRGIEESELARKRAIEKERLERERLEEERRERERLERERERLERERLEAERREAERQEKIRIERERIERERIEIERIEKIKRERIERERREKEKQREEEDRLRREREELERIERERRQLEIEERELVEKARREAEDRERERLEDEAREARRREEERREAELLADIQRQAEERERLRRHQEREEQERLDRIRREQQRIEQERADADRRERERLEEERREKELLEAQKRARDQREQERLDDIERERARQEEERKERERREAERRAAIERERKRRQDEEDERLRVVELQRLAAARDAQRRADIDRDREREELDREARKVSEMERLEKERRDRERAEEERSLADLRDKERRNQEIRDRERLEAAEREAARRLDDRRSRDKLDHLVRERTEKERFEIEKRRLLSEKEAMNKKRYDLTSPETLAKLTRPPYFSRDNLNTEVTTKVERQVIERVDRNVWVDDYRYPASHNAIQYSLDSTNEDNARDRLYNPNDLGRNGSTRTSRYRDRARMEKARRDFITGAPDSTDLNDRFLRRSTDDLSVRSRPEYRGPLLQKFHDSEFKSKNDVDNLPYSRVGPSEYGKEFERLLEETERKYAAYRMRMSQPNLYSRSRQYSQNYVETDVDTGRPDLASTTREVEETNLDEIHRRSGSVVDYNRMSRRDASDHATGPSDAHIRSRSADYLMDRRLREETEPPENQLQKAMEASPRSRNVSEHELRFRKSTEKLTVPDWYRENRPTGRPTDVDLTLPRRPYVDNYSQQYSQGFNYTNGGYSQAPVQTPSGHQNLDMPRGMFDRYKDEIEDMRRSRSSLHHLAQDQINRQEPLRPSPKPRRSLSQEVITSVHFHDSALPPKTLPGYTVSEIPGTWNIERTRSSRVIEVADTFVGPKYPEQHGAYTTRYGGRVTIEEVLDSIFQSTRPTRLSEANAMDNVYQGNNDGPGIYTNNYSLMNKVMKQPEIAENLLKSEALFVRCSFCHRSRELSQAKLQFVSCKHCYTYYCSRDCRANDWPQHNNRCSFARINTLCKDVIMKVREDPQAQACMSRIARDGFATSGRGSVNIRLASPLVAQAYVQNGWSALQDVPPQQLLYFYTISALTQEKKEPSLIALCERYDPSVKFILSVSIIADIENCPQTPPPEGIDWPRILDYNQHVQYNPYSPITLVPTDV
ncbi:unnamed protein product [Auanema sp. JU1783]|nr:unnamed protein product [Auanema sp. JU1783]